MTTQNDDPWQGAYEIPWDDPDFSRRMLAEHLTQDHDVAVSTFSVTETESRETRVYRSTTQAWSDDDLAELFSDSGFRGPTPYRDWPCNTNMLALWVAATA